MRRRIQMVTALVLSAVLTAALPLQASTQTVSEKLWGAALTEGDYVESPHSEDVPTVSESGSSLKKATSYIPSSYMNSLSDLTIWYPQTRSQGDYNTCWAFSAISLAELDLIRDNQTADKSIDLSELQLAYFTYHNVTDVTKGTVGDSLSITKMGEDYLSIGGNVDYAARTLLQWEGVVNESLFPYTAAASMSVLSDSAAFAGIVAHLQNVYIINIHDDQDAVKREIINHGGAGIGVYMSSARYVGSTVYNEETVATYYCPSEETPDHAVTIVGWDDNFPASGFADTPQGNGAWLVRNSWSDTAENSVYSYYWLSYYDKSIEDGAWILDFESADNYDYNNQYDGGSYVGEWPYASVSANIFQAQNAANELLEAVSISMTSKANVPYTILIYTNLADRSKPKSGVLAATLTGTTDYAGVHTIKLEQPLSVPKGTYYSVIVKLGNGAGMDAELAASGSGLRSNVYCSTNQSLFYYDGEWKDMAQFGGFPHGNLCIKAYTDQAEKSTSGVSDLKKTKLSKQKVKLSWSGVSGAQGYEVYRAVNKNGAYKLVKTTTSKSVQIKKTSKKYYYKVCAYKLSGDTKIYGTFSNIVSVVK